MTRQFLRAVCRALVGVVLFAQLAVSAYACPGMASAVAMKMPMSATAPADVDAHATPAAAPALQAMNCEDMAGPMGPMGPMDPTFANLCAEHCHQGQQSDQTATLAVPAVLLTALYTTPLAAEHCAAPRPAAAATCAGAAASPPLAILHCCFRI